MENKIGVAMKEKMKNHCQHCGSGDNLAIVSRKHDRIYFMCRPCNTERLRNYRKTESGKAAVLRAVKKYEKNHPEKYRSWWMAKIFPTKPCVKCGKFPAHRHHPDTKKPLDIVFLCPLHHKMVHAAA